MSPTAPFVRRSRSTGEVIPEFFRPISVALVSYEDLASALAGQIIDLLKADRIRPGDVLYQMSAVMDVLTRHHSSPVLGRRTGSQVGTVIELVARRYGLVRHRPVRIDDPTPPSHPGRPRCWEISAGAALIVPVVEKELGSTWRAGVGNA